MVVTSPFLYLSCVNKNTTFGPFPKETSSLNGKTISCTYSDVSVWPKKRIRTSPSDNSRAILMCVASALVNERAASSCDSNVLFMLPNSTITDDQSINVSLPPNYWVYNKKSVKILNTKDRMDKKLTILFLNTYIIDEKIRNQYEILITDGIFEYNQMRLASNMNSISVHRSKLPKLFHKNHPFVAGVKSVQMKNDIIKRIIKDKESNFFVIGLSYIPANLNTVTSNLKILALKELYISSSKIDSVEKLNYIALIRFGGTTNKELAIIPLEKIRKRI